ncbi:hypothetical protein Q5762_09825 [Streptomyces sp. P9(2023)]|uniref:hypothetical protein n=1 Tax=Streptomyces sp. P9(2023) TaxID=3064394 RepID=UPI0028F3EBF1|nr:hypothetical protein [Streptomyces sp. P9(2023)]MDT9688647.1 hypothetical protein [Streptomyces sp. P9(2023)]
MRTFKGTATVAAGAVSLALLLTACGGGEKSDDKGAPKASGSASASASAAPDAKALSVAELEKLIVEQADLKGYQVQKAEAADVVKPGDVATDKPACKPIADVLSSIAPGGPAADVLRQAIEVPKKEGATAAPEDILGAFSAPATSVVLGSHDGAGAQEALASLKAAGPECAGGFALLGGGEKTKVLKVAPESITAGEEAVAYTVTTDVEGAEWVSKVVAFRKGNTLASFATISLGGKVKELPKTVIDAQAAKLG